MACPRTGAGCSEKCDAGRWVLPKSSQTAASTRTWQRPQMCGFCEGLTQSLVAMCVFSICSRKPQGINSRPKKKGLVFHTPVLSLRNRLPSARLPFCSGPALVETLPAVLGRRHFTLLKSRQFSAGIHRCQLV